MFVYTIQPVVKPVVQPGLTTGWMNRCSFNTVVKPCLSNRFVKHGLTAGWMNSCSFNTVVKPVVNPLWYPVWQPAVSWIQTFNRLYNPVWHGCTTRFDNRLDVCLHDTAFCQTGCTTGLTTCCTTGCYKPVVSCKQGLRDAASFTSLFSWLTKKLWDLMGIFTGWHQWLELLSMLWCSSLGNRSGRASRL